MSLRRWLARYGLPLGVFAAILLQGATLGLTDDEAYYWVLAQRPALGYAFHPPMIGWSVALAQGLLGWLFGHHCAGLVRLPAAVCGALYVWLASRWIERTGASHPQRGGWVMAAFAGIYALVWMIVPDLPLFAGWTLAFTATWAICFGERAGGLELAQLALGTAIALLSKYTGVLGGASAFAAILLWAPRERRLPALGALALGGLCAAVPVLWWNSQHEWASILYQLRERHGEAHFSALRYPLLGDRARAARAGPGL
jgi:4-amino-4-deoxy-L-arabinose transferase-like glycosyltransferase